MLYLRKPWIWLVIVLLILAAIVLLPLGGDTIEGVGTADVIVPDSADKPLEAKIWYPLAGGGRESTGTQGLPLIVLSHGTGGSLSGHGDTAVALARSGFIVIAVNHSGDNFRDQSYVGKGLHLIGRPRHVSRAIDYMLTGWKGPVRVDAKRIGLFGHSAGGFTALVIAGGHPDIGLGIAHCREQPDAWDCRYLRNNGLDIAKRLPVPASTWTGDPRVRAIAIAAPAVGYSFAPKGLAEVTIPVQLWQGGQDDIVDDSPAIIRRLLPRPPEFHDVERAGHFSFLMPCDWRMTTIISLLHLMGTQDVCDDPAGFDRGTFHATFNRDIVAFFDRNLRGAAAPAAIER